MVISRLTASAAYERACVCDLFKPFKTKIVLNIIAFVTIICKYADGTELSKGASPDQFDSVHSCIQTRIGDVLI